MPYTPENLEALADYLSGNYILPLGAARANLAQAITRNLNTGAGRDAARDALRALLQPSDLQEPYLKGERLPNKMVDLVAAGVLSNITTAISSTQDGIVNFITISTSCADAILTLANGAGVINRHDLETSLGLKWTPLQAQHDLDQVEKGLSPSRHGIRKAHLISSGVIAS